MRAKINTPSSLSKSPEFTERSRELVDKTRRLSADSELGMAPQWDAIVQWFFELILNHNWTRKNVYELIGNVIENHGDDLDTTGLDMLMDFESAMCGDIGPGLTPKFPGDPEDPLDFARYIDSGAWLD